MSINHREEPRNVGYSADHAEYYQDKENSWIRKESDKIFAGKKQKDLFIFAMALGKNRSIKSELNLKEKQIINKQNNVSVEAMNERQKWALLSIGIAESENLLCLQSEKPIYELAEKYAQDGIEILKSHMNKHGPNYPKFLELELKEILGIES